MMTVVLRALLGSVMALFENKTDSRSVSNLVNRSVVVRSKRNTRLPDVGWFVETVVADCSAVQALGCLGRNGSAYPRRAAQQPPRAELVAGARRLISPAVRGVPVGETVGTMFGK